MVMKRIVNGVEVEMTPQEEAAKLARWAAERNTQATRDWEEKDKVLGSLIPNHAFDLIDSLVAAGVITTDDLVPSLKKAYDDRKAHKAVKPT